MITFYYIISLLLGISLGSFLNALVWRTRENIKIGKDRSMCPHCRRRLTWYENIPILSFIFLRGRARKCGKRISRQYPIVELVMGVLFLFVFYFHARGELVFTPEIVRDWFIVFNLSFIFLYDFKYQEILDFSTIPSIIILVLFSPAIGWHSWQSIGLAMLIGGGFFLAQYILSRGKWIGGGDIRLGFLMGVILGWPNIVLGLFLAYIIGAVISLIMVSVKRQDFKGETPFGTYLVLGTFVAMFWGERIVGWYLSLLN
ncbi:MAG: prepilin peptidase [Candidatus Magasanikbacteria bacterium]|jgi:prepilin signal peptidase PulO-like enzyme (type II secretory pathway)|nr:prepilin peptidase [Candidatus Magasanikbacteria bacterium]MBT4314893.1 prepilin peptidase [Candidatus Magasanikbacteria bacterium]MBT4546849.1 prepilin peptidase [Candidatus Magasanikbacteria bacterium]MBT6819278.1 prepilin peptidase [Candidatus Magasanikbacteria bacterium]